MSAGLNRTHGVFLAGHSAACNLDSVRDHGGVGDIDRQRNVVKISESRTGGDRLNMAFHSAAGATESLAQPTSDMTQVSGRAMRTSKKTSINNQRTADTRTHS